jgi:hypothetical protein
MSYIERVAVSFILILFLVSPSYAQSGSNAGYELSDSSLDERYDWVITVQVKIVKDYLKYPTSSLNPMTKLSVVSRETPRLQKDRTTKVVQYEDLWYHDCNAIGCRRYSELSLTPGQQGTIRILPSEDANNSACAVANALTRLILDVGLLRCSLSVVYVPDGMLDEITNDLAKFNFFPYNARPDHPIRTSMVLCLISDPPGQKRSLYYDPNNK